MFPANQPFVPDETTGIKLIEWLNKGKKGKRITVSARIKQLHDCADLESLQAAFQNILKTRKSYSKPEMQTLIAAKDKEKSILSDEPVGQDEDAPEEPYEPEQKENFPPPPPADDKPTEPETNQPTKEPPTKELLHEDVIELNRLWNDKVHKKDIQALIDEDKTSAHEINYYIANNKAADALVLLKLINEKVG